MTSSGLEWDYYEFQPVDSSSVEYATPGTNSFLLPTNPANSYWNANAISDWSMSIHTAHTSGIVKEKVALVKEIKEEKDKKNQRRKARKDPRRSEREKEVRNLVPESCLELHTDTAACNILYWQYSMVELLKMHGCMAGLYSCCFAKMVYPSNRFH